MLIKTPKEIVIKELANRDPPDDVFRLMLVLRISENLLITSGSGEVRISQAVFLTASLTFAVKIRKLIDP